MEIFQFYDIAYKTSMGLKPLGIRFDKIDEFIIALDGKTKHLLLFDYGLFDKIFDKIEYLMSTKSSITDSIDQNYGQIRIDSYNSLLIQKIIIFHNVIILIISVVNQNENEHCYNIFLEKDSYKDKSNTRYL